MNNLNQKNDTKPNNSGISLESYLLRNKILMKVAKEKANEIYKNSMFLHGLETAKKEALNSAKAIEALAPYEQKEYWNNVISELEKK